MTRVDLFRAVEPLELAGIEAEGRFTNLPGIMSKYFSLTLPGVRQFMRMATTGLGLGPFAIVHSTIDASLIRPEFRVTVDRGISTVVLPTELLAYLTPPNVLEIGP